MSRWPNLTVAERFFAKVDKTDTCWLWTASTSEGYGRFSPTSGGSQVGAHRWSYEHHVGPIPAGLEIDHLCRVRGCVRPDHLEVVTHAENNARKIKLPNCKYGHPYDAANTYVDPNGYRSCRTCASDRARAYRQRRAGKRAA